MRTFYAHAFGARYDLPIPLSLFVAAGALVVVASFVVTQARGSTARRTTGESGAEAAPAMGNPAWGAVATMWLAFLTWCGYAGSQLVAENIIVTWFWLGVWIAIPLSCAVIGDWTRPVNPYAFLTRCADSPRLRRVILGSRDPVRWPDRLGWWPAVFLLFAGACGELIFNLTTTVPHVTADILAGYAALTVVMGFLFGPRWLDRGEAFGVLFDTWGRLGFFRFGSPGRRGFARGLDRGFAPSVSLVAFVLLMLVNVNFDGLLSTPQWAKVLRQLPSGYNVPSPRQHDFNVLAFVLLAVTLGVILTMFAHASAVAGRHHTAPLVSFTRLLPSMVPIAFGYLFAHNLEYLLVNGQLMLPLLGNPPGTDSWPLHLPYPFNDDYEVHHAFLPSGFYWYASLLVIVAVHVAAVVIAHRQLAATAGSPRLAARSEYPWLVAMVAYTCLSLWLLAQPLTHESATTPGKDVATGGAAIHLPSPERPPFADGGAG